MNKEKIFIDALKKIANNKWEDCPACKGTCKNSDSTYWCNICGGRGGHSLNTEAIAKKALEEVKTIKEP